MLWKLQYIPAEDTCFPRYSLPQQLDKICWFLQSNPADSKSLSSAGPCPSLVEIIPFYTSKVLQVAPPQPPLVRDTLNSGWETRSTITSKCHRAEIPSRKKHVTVSGRSVWVCNILNCRKKKQVGTVTDQVLCKYQRNQIIPAVPQAIQVVVTVPPTPKVPRVPTVGASDQMSRQGQISSTNLFFRLKEIKKKS